MTRRYINNDILKVIFTMVKEMEEGEEIKNVVDFCKLRFNITNTNRKINKFCITREYDFPIALLNINFKFSFYLKVWKTDYYNPKERNLVIREETEYIQYEKLFNYSYHNKKKCYKWIEEELERMVRSVVILKCIKHHY